MKKRLKVLIIEDSEPDSVLLIQALEKSAYEVDGRRIETEKELQGCVQENWDIILADYGMPGFSGLKALEILFASGRDIPIIIISGMIGEERAASVMKAGAHDFIMKDNLSRLGPAVEIQILEGMLRREKYQADRVLRESEERMRVLVDGIKDYAIFMLSPDGVMQSWNNGVRRFLGYDEEEFLGLPYSSLFMPEDREAGLPAHELARACSTGRVESERWNIRRNGEAFWVLGVTTALRGANGELLGFASIMRDETERKAGAEEKERLYAKAQEASRIRDEFLATLSHELRTPLNAILGFSELLAMESPDSEDFAYSLDAINRNAQIQNRLITDLLDVSRIITGKLSLDMQPVQLVEVLEEALAAVKLAARSKNVTIHRDFAASCATVLGDKARLQQVCWNLLNNAVKFTGNNGKIEVRLHLSEGYLQLDVADNGQGIEPDFLPYVFERFRQEDGSKTRHFGGLGLGLAIVRHMAEAHGGTVRVESSGKNRGATFSVYLQPLQELVESSYEKPAPTKPEPLVGHPFHAEVLQNARILVVEDQSDTCDRRVFDRAGAQVVEAVTGEDGDLLLTRIRPRVDPDSEIPTPGPVGS